LSHLESSHPDVLTEIKEKKVISPELEAKMKNILENFKGIFTPPELSIV
jgi:F-type H+-transporting ATPase subunit alpha